MKLICRPGPLRGNVVIPGSKSHTIRAVAIASLAEGQSHIEAPLVSQDTLAAVKAYRALGAHIETARDSWVVQGTAGVPKAPEEAIDVGNSGTTLRVAMGSCALIRDGRAVLSGDEQIRSRPSEPLAQSLRDLGAEVSSQHNNGCPPYIVGGPLRGGETSIEAVTSQYLSSLLLCCPLAEGDSTILVPLLNEAPYVDLTLDWLRRQDIRFEQDEKREFRVPGGQRFKPFTRRIPADFSSATFFLCAGAMPGCETLVRGLDMDDPQGDKAVIDYLRQMGAGVETDADGVHVRHSDLKGCEIDMNPTPDALPMMAALACLARGKTRLANVPQARIKESDRITVMAEELSKMGARTRELDDGLEIEESPLRGAKLDGHGDHRIVMALAVAATAASGESSIETAEAIHITFPGFVECMKGLGANIEMSNSG